MWRVMSFFCDLMLICLAIYVLGLDFKHGVLVLVLGLVAISVCSLLFGMKRYTFVVDSKAELVNKRLVGESRKYVIKSVDGNILMCQNDWPLQRNAKKTFQKIRVGKKYSFITYGIHGVDTPNIMSVKEVKSTKSKVVKR